MDSSSNPVAYNRNAWDHQVKNKNRWTVPVDSETIRLARQGQWEVVLTPTKPVPRPWFPDLAGCRVLCLAGGGGQQAPVLAAAGASVTVFDNSQEQLNQDQLVAKRDGLEIESIQGDMADLRSLSDDSFDLVFHPCSNSFVPDVRPVWQEAYRVLRPGGCLLSGFCNPIGFIFDYDKSRQGELEVRHSIPYSDITSLSEEEKAKLIYEHEPFCFGHSLEDQIAGQTDAGFSIVGFYEDYWGDDKEPLDRFIASFIATRAVKSLRC